MLIGRRARDDEVKKKIYSRMGRGDKNGGNGEDTDRREGESGEGEEEEELSTGWW